VTTTAAVPALLAAVIARDGTRCQEAGCWSPAECAVPEDAAVPLVQAARLGADGLIGMCKQHAGPWLARGRTARRAAAADALRQAQIGLFTTGGD
jgi:hypothetical protein